MPTQNKVSGNFKGFLSHIVLSRHLCFISLFYIGLLLMCYVFWFCFPGFSVCINMCVFESICVSYASSLVFFFLFLLVLPYFDLFIFYLIFINFLNAWIFCLFV